MRCRGLIGPSKVQLGVGAAGSRCSWAQVQLEQVQLGVGAARTGAAGGRFS